jgi:hypothetical protein
VTGIIRIRVTRLPEGWRAEVPGMILFRTETLPTKLEAVEALRQLITNAPGVTALEVDEVLLRMDKPFTGEE